MRLGRSWTSRVSAWNLIEQLNLLDDDVRVTGGISHNEMRSLILALSNESNVDLSFPLKSLWVVRANHKHRLRLLTTVCPIFMAVFAGIFIDRPSSLFIECLLWLSNTRLDSNSIPKTLREVQTKGISEIFCSESSCRLELSWFN